MILISACSNNRYKKSYKKPPVPPFTEKTSTVEVKGYGIFKKYKSDLRHNVITYAGFDKETCISLREYMETEFRKKFSKKEWHKQGFWLSDSETECYSTFYKKTKEVKLMKLLSLTRWSPDKKYIGKIIKKYSSDLAIYNNSIHYNNNEYHTHFSTEYIKKLFNLSESEWQSSKYDGVKKILYNCNKCNYNLYNYIPNNDTLKLNKKLTN